MSTTPIRRTLYIDESGVIGGDAKQPWLVLAGVDVPTANVQSLEQYYRDVCEEFLPTDIASRRDLDLKGSQLFKRDPNGPSWLKGVPYERRVELGRQLLNAPCLDLGVRFYVSAIDTREPLPKKPLLPIWPEHIEDLLGQSCRTYLFALVEMVGDFAFHLDRDMSSGMDELMMRPREERCIDGGRIMVDENSILKTRLEELEAVLRQQRYRKIQTVKIPYRLLDQRIDTPWQYCDSKKHIAIQFADILASIVKLKHAQEKLPPDLAHTYFDARLDFLCGRSHFYPRENVHPEEVLYFAGIPHSGLVVDN